jgi:hypothetical protein
MRRAIALIWRLMGLGPSAPFRIMNPDTGEIRERPEFSTLVDDHDWYRDICGKVASALGPDVLKRWEDGDEGLDLAAEVREARERAEGCEAALGTCSDELAECEPTSPAGVLPENAELRWPAEPLGRRLL